MGFTRTYTTRENRLKPSRRGDRPKPLIYLEWLLPHEELAIPRHPMEEFMPGMILDSDLKLPAPWI